MTKRLTERSIDELVNLWDNTPQADDRWTLINDDLTITELVRLDRVRDLGWQPLVV
jgi:hypothetical protein